MILDKILRGTVLALCGVLAACAGAPPARPPVPVEDRGASAPPAPTSQPVPGAPVPTVLEPAPAMEPLPPPVAAPPAPANRPAAVVALLNRQETASRSGNLPQAAAELERALRIAPADADLWLRLARIRLQQKQWPQAESLALKALSLARADPALVRGGWEVFAAARSGRGDAAGAAAARERAAMAGG